MIKVIALNLPQSFIIAARKRLEEGERKPKTANQSRKNADYDSLRNEKVQSDQSDLSVKKESETARKIASEHNVSYGAVVRADSFAKGLDTADKIAPGKHLHIIFGDGKPHVKIK